MIDAPGGGGKVPAIPNYIQEINDKKVIMKNFEGETYEYPQVEDYK